MQGKIFETNLARAEYFYLTGNYQKAIKQLEIAKNYAPTKDIVALQKIDYRISEILEFIRFIQYLNN